MSVTLLMLLFAVFMQILNILHFCSNRVGNEEINARLTSPRNDLCYFKGGVKVAAEGFWRVHIWSLMW